MQLQLQLDRLQARLTTILHEVPGATTLYLFGSRATHHHDHYADIDLQLVTADLPAARAVWPHVLERAGPIELAWPITAAEDNTAFSIVFQGESYYHKVDIGLSSITDFPRFAPVATYVPLWSQPPPTTMYPQIPTNAYLPAYGSSGHLLFDTLLTSVRYIKARKRSQDVTCWRFLRGKPDLLLQLLYEQAHHWQDVGTTLSTLHYKELDRLLEPDERAQFLQYLSWSQPAQMDLQLCRLTQRIAVLLQQKALAHGEGIPANIVTQQLAFLWDQLQPH